MNWNGFSSEYFCFSPVGTILPLPHNIHPIVLFKRLTNGRNLKKKAVIFRIPEEATDSKTLNVA
jgi:hypothetical protein